MEQDWRVSGCGTVAWYLVTIDGARSVRQHIAVARDRRAEARSTGEWQAATLRSSKP
ncbi:MAG: hypothetical protein ABI699_08865 [Caldimonas sp.]